MRSLPYSASTLSGFRRLHAVRTYRVICTNYHQESSSCTVTRGSWWGSRPRHRRPTASACTAGPASARTAASRDPAAPPYTPPTSCSCRSRFLGAKACCEERATRVLRAVCSCPLLPCTWLAHTARTAVDCCRARCMHLSLHGVRSEGLACSVPRRRAGVSQGSRSKARHGVNA